MKNSYRNINEIFNDEFSEVTLEWLTVDLEKGKSHCIFLTIPSEEYLSKSWLHITNSIALNYQNYLETNFEKWNIYLFFLISEPIEDLNLKYTIENNTFSSRKIVEDVTVSKDFLIRKYVNNQLSLETGEVDNEQSPFSYNPIIWDTLKDKKIKKINILHDELMKTYEELIARLK